MNFRHIAYQTETRANGTTYQVIALILEFERDANGEIRSKAARAAIFKRRMLKAGLDPKTIRVEIENVMDEREAF